MYNVFVPWTVSRVLLVNFKHDLTLIRSVFNLQYLVLKPFHHPKKTSLLLSSLSTLLSFLSLDRLFNLTTLDLLKIPGFFYSMLCFQDSLALWHMDALFDFMV